MIFEQNEQGNNTFDHTINIDGGQANLQPANFQINGEFWKEPSKDLMQFVAALSFAMSEPVQLHPEIPSTTKSFFPTT